MEELNLGKKLQAIRTSKKISVRKLAAMTNLTASMISQIENGAVNPSIPTLRTISSALETPIYYFFKTKTMPLSSSPRAPVWCWATSRSLPSCTSC